MRYLWRAIGVFVSAGIGGLFCYFGIALCAGLSVTWQGLLGAVLAAFGFVWLVSKATEKPDDNDAMAEAWLAALSPSKESKK